MNTSEALYCIPPNISRDEWVKVAQALKSNGEPFESFDAWSSTAANYNQSDSRAVWKSISANGGIGIGTLFYIAMQYGLKPSSIDREAVEIAKAKSRQLYLQDTKDKAIRQQQVAVKAEAILAESHRTLLSCGYHRKPCEMFLRNFFLRIKNNPVLDPRCLQSARLHPGYRKYQWCVQGK